MRLAAFSMGALLLLLSLTMFDYTEAAIIYTNEASDEESSADNIPIPADIHAVEAIAHVVCTPSECHLENEISTGGGFLNTTNWANIEHDIIVHTSSFNSSDDRDVLLLAPMRNDSRDTGENVPSQRDLVYRLCIIESEVPMRIEAWSRDATTLLQIGEVTGNTPLTDESADDVCTRFAFSAAEGTELWLETSTLSIAGNYTLVFSAIEVGEKGVTPLMTHDLSIGGSEHSSEVVNSGTSLVGNHTIFSHPTPPDYIWKLNSVADAAHTLRMDCIREDGTGFECGNYSSSLRQDGMHSIGQEDNSHYPPQGIIAFEVTLELFTPATWAVEHDLNASHVDPIMWFFESEPFVNELSMVHYPGGDAPGNMSDLQCDMDEVHYLGCRYYPDNEGLRYNGRVGYLPLATFDEADVYAIDIWPVMYDLTFILEVNIQAEAGSVMLELHSFDENGTRSVTSLTPMTDEIEKIQLEVDAGVHYIRVVNVRLGAVQNWSYGDLDQPVIEYWLGVDWIANTSGEVEDYSPSEQVLFWDKVLLWSFGPIFLLPLAWVLLNIRKDRERLQILLHDRQRLARLRVLTDPGQIEEAKKDLEVFLAALAQVDWEVLLSTWGEPDISHITGDAQLHMWRLADGLAAESAIPLLVMVEVDRSDWQITALRFEAPEGSAWRVSKVQPNLLSRGNEVFLDDLKVGNRIFVNVELEGEADRIALHLSGVQAGNPVAAKPSQSLHVQSSEAE